MPTAAVYCGPRVGELQLTSEVLGFIVPNADSLRDGARVLLVGSLEPVDRKLHNVECGHRQVPRLNHVVSLTNKSVNTCILVRMWVPPGGQGDRAALSL